MPAKVLAREWSREVGGTWSRCWVLEESVRSCSLAESKPTQLHTFKEVLGTFDLGETAPNHMPKHVLHRRRAVQGSVKAPISNIQLVRYLVLVLFRQESVFAVEPFTLCFHASRIQQDVSDGGGILDDHRNSQRSDPLHKLV